MPRLIDADALENEVHTFCREFLGSCRDFRTKCALYDAMKGVLVRIYDAPTISPDDVRGVGEWEDNYPILVELECLRCKNCNKLVQIGRYCANCGERKKGAEDETTDNA